MTTRQKRLDRLERQLDIGSASTSLFIILNMRANPTDETDESIDLDSDRGTIHRDLGESWTAFKERALRMSPGQRFFIAKRGAREGVAG